MKYFSTLFLVLFTTVLSFSQVKFEFKSTINYSTITINSTFAEHKLLGKALTPVDNSLTAIETGVDNTVDTGIDFINQHLGTDINTETNTNLDPVSDWINKDRVFSATRYTVGSEGTIYYSGIGMSGTVEFGYSNLTIATVGARLRAYVTPEIINLFGGDLEPLNLGNLSLNWLRALELGYSQNITSEQILLTKGISSSINARLNLLFEYSKNYKSNAIFGLYFEGSKSLTTDISDQISMGLFYQF